MSTEFQREERYVVFKLSDVEEHFTPSEKQHLERLVEVQRAGREEAGKPPLECVVVESDWPEYEPTWKAIEARVMGAQPAPNAVAYLDLGVGGYMDVGTDLTDEELAALPKGRHMLGIVGTYGIEGYVPAQPAPSVPDGWKEGVEAAARLIDQKAELYAIRFGHDDMGMLSFGTGARAEIKMDHYTSLLELADEVRAMLAAAPETKP